VDGGLTDPAALSNMVLGKPPSSLISKYFVSPRDVAEPDETFMY
jgi:hypothetical protein